MAFHRESKQIVSSGKEQRTSKSEEAANASFVPIRVPIHEKNLLNVEFAMQLFFLQHKTRSISYEQFCKSLAPKLVLEPPTASLSTTKNEGPSNDSDGTELVQKIEKLARNDRLWHDLTCILAPRVYSMEASKPGESSPSGAKAGDQTCTTTTLVRGENSKQHMGLVKTLINHASTNGIDKKRSVEMIRKIQQDKQLLFSKREKKIQERRSCEATRSEVANSSGILDPIAAIKPGMTLEQRVRARASERDQALEKASKNEDRDKSMDLVKVSDALFSHARLLMRKRKRKLQQSRRLMTTATLKDESSTCVLQLQDLLSAIPNISRPKMSRYIVLLSKDYPEMIRWKNPNGYRPREEKLSKKATVWLETGNYQSVRAKISGEATNPENQMPVSLAIRRLNFSLQKTASLSGQKRSNTAVGKYLPLSQSKRQNTNGIK